MAPDGRSDDGREPRSGNRGAGTEDGRRDWVQDGRIQACAGRSYSANTRPCPRRGFVRRDFFLEPAAGAGQPLARRVDPEAAWGEDGASASRAAEEGSGKNLGERSPGFGSSSK